MATTVKTTKVSEEKQARLWWRIIRGTWRGSRILFRNVYIDGRVFYGQSKTKIQARYRAWQRERNFKPEEIDSVEVDEVPRGRRRKFRSQYLCFACDRKYSSAYGLNKHFSKTHGAESLPRERLDRKAIIGRDGTDRVWYRPQIRATRTPATPKTTRSAKPMDSITAQAMKSAWGHMYEARPTLLSEIRNDLVGIEQAMGMYGPEAIAAYRAHLIRLNFDPGTLQNLVRAAEEMSKVARLFSATIAVIEDFYAPDIAAARARAAGAKPADNTLAR